MTQKITTICLIVIASLCFDANFSCPLVKHSTGIPVVDIASNIMRVIQMVESKVQSLTAVKTLVSMLQQLQEMQMLYNQGVQMYTNIGNFGNRIRNFIARPGAGLDSLVAAVRRGDFIALNQQLGIGRDTSSPIYRLNDDTFGGGSFLTRQLANLNQSVDIVENYNAGHFLRNVASGASDQVADETSRLGYNPYLAGIPGYGPGSASIENRNSYGAHNTGSAGRYTQIQAASHRQNTRAAVADVQTEKLMQNYQQAMEVIMEDMRSANSDADTRAIQLKLRAASATLEMVRLRQESAASRNAAESRSTTNELLNISMDDERAYREISNLK